MVSRPRPMNRHLLAGLLVFLPILQVLGDHLLPGTGAADTPSNARKDDPRNGLHRVARDSNGYWYVVFEANSQRLVILCYTTTTTPTATTDWGVATLVSSGSACVINAAPANNQHGNRPSIAFDPQDHLHFVWFTDSNNAVYHSYCSNLAALTTSANWSAPLIADSSGTGFMDYSFAVDTRGMPHLAGRNKNDHHLNYTQYDTNTATWLTPKDLSAGLSEPTVTSDTINLVCGLENEVYVAWMPDNASDQIWMMACSNAESQTPANTTWLNVAQNSSTPDVVNAGTSPALSNSLGMAPALCADYEGFVYVAWIVSGDVIPPWDYFCVRVGQIGCGISYIPDDPLIDYAEAQQPLGRDLNFVSSGNGQVRLLSDCPDTWGDQTQTEFLIYVHPPAARVYRVRQDWGSGWTTGNNYNWVNGTCPNYFCAAPFNPRDRGGILGFVYDGPNKRIKCYQSPSMGTTDSAGAGWTPPRVSGTVPHPHLKWVFPMTATPPGSLTLPVVTQTSKSAVYTVDGLPTGHVYALDRTTGRWARSATLTGSANALIASTYGSNVHLFIQEGSNSIRHLLDNGSTISAAANWTNNPKVLAVASGGTPPLLITQSGTRYLYTLAAGQLFRLYADNGNTFAGFPVGGAYDMSPVEGVLKIMNDQVFMPGNLNQIHRRASDGTAAVSSSAIPNLVRHLLPQRSPATSLFVAPENNWVYQLDSSSMATAVWTAGKSADMGSIKTSGAGYTRGKNMLYVGKGNLLYRLNATDGSQVSNWPQPSAGNIITLPVEWKTYVYFGTDTGTLFAVNATTNIARPNWPIQLSTAASTPKVKYLSFDATANLVYFATNEGRIYKFSLE